MADPAPAPAAGPRPPTPQRFPASLALLVALAAWLSFQFNLFGVMSQHHFESQPSASEGLVIFGILSQADSATPTSPLGRYDLQRPGYLTPPELQRLFEQRLQTGPYQPYDSQFGLQGYFWRAVHRVTGASIATMHAINSALFAGLLGMLSLLLASRLGNRAAMAFAATILLAPWVLVFATDLYWVAWTWFAPMLVTLAASTGRLGRSVLSPPALIAFFLAMLVRLLCGYEYASTIVIAAFCPLFLDGLRGRARQMRVIREILLLGLVSLLAFVVAIAAHAHRLESSGSQAGSGGAIRQIGQLAQKRLHSGQPQQIARQACLDDFWHDPQCEQLYVESLTANPLRVVAQYVVFRKLLPWFSRWEEEPPSDAFRHDMQLALDQRSPATMVALAKAAPADAAPLLMRGINTLLFLALSITAFLRLLRGPNANPALAAMLLMALFAPLSWFIAAKGHSYIHVGFNYVLWYLPFVPFACALALAPVRPQR